MSYRSNLLLVTCVTCFGFAPSPAVSLDAALRHPVAAGPWLLQPWRTAPPQTAVASTVIAQATPGNDAPPHLKLGSEGQHVAELQAMLQQLEFYDGVADGRYGEGTRLAVIRFQNAEELRPTGEVGSGTWKRLKQATVESIASDPTTASSNPSPTASPADVTANATDAPTGNQESPGVNSSIGRAWIWLLLGALTIVIAGIAAVWGRKYILSQRSERSELGDGDKSPVAGDRSLQDPSKTSVPEGDRNGHNSHNSKREPDQDHSDGTALTPEPKLSETTRLSKIDIVEELIKDLHDPDPKKRRKAIWELGQRGDSKAIQPLVDLMMDSDSHQRSLILASVSEITVRALKPMNRALLISLQDESSEVRKNAIRDLTKVYDLLTQASQLLRHAVEDADEEVQETARWALGQLNRLRFAPDSENFTSLPKSNPPSEHLPGDTSDSH